MPKVKFSIDHWVNGIPWAETGVYDYMLMRIKERKLKGEMGIDECENMQDIIKRYETLDLIFEQVKREGRHQLCNIY